MTREEFRYLAAGQIAYQRRTNTIDIKELDTYVEGALFGFDFAWRMIRKDPNFKLEGKSEGQTAQNQLNNIDLKSDLMPKLK